MDEPAEPLDASPEIRMGPDEAGLRLDRALAARLPDLSRSRLKALIEQGQVFVRPDRTEIERAEHGAASGTSGLGIAQRDPSMRVRPGQNFVVILPDAEIAAPAPQPMPLDIRFEDAYILVIDKPAGMVVHPAPGNPDGTLVNALLAHCGDTLSGIGGVRRPGIVHRLDKDTSGLMVVAKTEPAHQALSRAFAERDIGRVYAAIVWGVPTPLSGEIEGNIGRSATNRKKMAVVAPSRGKPALTRYQVERVFGRHAALLHCRLATGRTHQIRVHLSARGHPLIGDPVYGTRSGRMVARSGEIGACIAAFPRQALHARSLALRHPVTGEQLQFESALPPDLTALIVDLESL